MKRCIPALAIALFVAGCAGVAPATPSVSPAVTPVAPASSPPATASAGAVPSAATVPSPSAAESPDLGAIALGPRIVFGRWDAGFDEPLLFTVKPDGTDQRILLSKRVELPSWSADGSRLSVVGASPQGPVFVGLVDRDGSGYRAFDSPDPTLNLGCGLWSHDGTRLVCEGWDDNDPSRNGIYTVRASDGGDLQRVTTSPGGYHDAPGDSSPDGRQMVFVRSSPVDDNNTTVMIANSDGSHIRPLLRIKGATARWSPTGDMILTESAGTLLLIPVAGGKPTPITIHMTAPAIPNVASRPGWSPDGSQIVFSLVVSGSTSTDIYTMRRDGTDLVQITNTPQDEEFADWGN